MPMFGLRPHLTRNLSALGKDDQLAGAAGGLDLLARLGAEGMCLDCERLGDRTLGEDLDRDVLARGQALPVHRFERHGIAGLEALLEVEQVHDLGVSAEGLERHRLLHVRTAQLAHPHVDRVLTTLEACAPLGARARAPALLATARRLARARPLAATDALARPPRSRRGLQVVQPNPLFGLSHPRKPPRDGAPCAPCRAPAANPAWSRCGQYGGALASEACQPGACRRHCGSCAA